MMRETSENAEPSLAELTVLLRDFAHARGWHRYHNPRNLAMSLVIEAGELLECFQWLTDDQANAVKHQSAKMNHVRGELADVLIYLIHLADVLDVDLLRAARDKIAANEERY